MIALQREVMGARLFVIPAAEHADKVIEAFP
jgi:hypothetical protein